MIDMFDLWKRFCSDNNTFQGGFYRPERDFTEKVNSISLEAFAKFTAQDEKTQQIEDWLYPFATTANIIVVPAVSWSLAKYPLDYGAYKAARVLHHAEECFCEEGHPVFMDGEECFSKNEDPIEKVKRIDRYKAGIIEATVAKIGSSHWGACLEHETKCPTFESPKITQYSEGFKVAPLKVSVIVLDYYTNPVPAKFAYTVAPGFPQTGAGDYLIYNQAASTPLQWPQSMIPYFLDELQNSYSKFTRDTLLFQMNKAK